MISTINAAFDRSRAILLLLAFLLTAGAFAWLNIPKEASPDVAVPIVYVSMSHDGISPEDAERLLVRPMEKELQSIEGIKELKASAAEGHASVILTFHAGQDIKRALSDVREKVDAAKKDLPEATEEPVVEEVNFALFPIITVSLSGPIPERTLVQVARDLQDSIESIPSVLKADVGGNRDQLMEVVVDPLVLETYNIRYDEVLSLVTGNNKLVAAGAVDTGTGRMVLKVPGLVESVDDVLRLPVKVHNGTVVTFGDVAKVFSTFRDPEGFARTRGQPAVTLEVTKRVGANIIETIEMVRAAVEAARENLPANIEVAYMQDQSRMIRTILADLNNNVLTAIVLVMIVIIAALGVRSALLVGVAIPGAFLTGILVLKTIGYTLNIVVLFSLILVAGMLVDGAIVVSELADRNRRQGIPPREAFAKAAERMAWPVTASTLTTLAVFLPLLFWPGMVGQFMKYLPATVIICLTASLTMALIFVPVLGGTVFGPAHYADGNDQPDGRITLLYRQLLMRLLRRPTTVLLIAICVLAGSYALYGIFGRGVEFFPETEPELAQVQIHARGDLSIYQKDRLVREVEQRILDMPELRSVNSRSFNSAAGSDRAEDVVGVIQLEFVDWDRRRKAEKILAEMRDRTKNIAGVLLEFRKAEEGPAAGKPVQVEVSGTSLPQIEGAAAKVRNIMEQTGGFTDIEDSRPLPGIEWRIEIDREAAARFGADVNVLGYAVQMITSGIKVSDYRPEGSDDEVDIRIRFPIAERNLERLEQLTVPTVNGLVPISNFVTVVPAQKTGTITRVDGKRVVTIKSDVAEGLLIDEQVRTLKTTLAQTDLGDGIGIEFKGQDEEQREAASFLLSAFGIAVFLMAIVLVTQFNSLYQAALVLTAIVFSTAGVLLGLLVTNRPFGIVMVGIGIIALAGIVVNNNIVLIDTYNRIRREKKLSAVDAALETGTIRLRPVFLTAFTTVLGLMPMVLAMNVDLINRDITFGAPSSQWWTQLSSAIAGGLTFATLLTLLLTPCMLVLGEQFSQSTRNSLSRLFTARRRHASEPSAAG